MKVCQTQRHHSSHLTVVKSEYRDGSGQMRLLAQDTRQLLAHMCASLMTNLSRCHMSCFARWEAGTESSSLANTWPWWRHGEQRTRTDTHSPIPCRHYVRLHFRVRTGSCVGGDGWVSTSSLLMSLSHGSPQKHKVNKMERLQRSPHLLLWQICLFGRQ